MRKLVSTITLLRRRRAFLGIATAFSFPNLLVGQGVDIQTYTLPEIVEAAYPEFTPSQATEGAEGFVVVNFMVDTDGRAFDPIVVESTGNEEFHDAAIAAVMESRFDPAKLAGEPIVGGLRVVYPFNRAPGLSGDAAPRFRSAYQRFQRAVESGERESIEIALARLERQDIHKMTEFVYLGLARYSYALQYGSELEQLQHIRQTLLFGWFEEPDFLDEELIKNLRRAQFSLQVTNNYFGDAIDTFHRMESSGDAEGVAMFEDVVERLEAIRHDDTEYSIPLDLGEHGQTGLRLFKHRVAMIQGEGGLNEVVLRCDRHYVAFPVERDVSYEVPPDWGECWIEIRGDAGANFLLLQH